VIWGKVKREQQELLQENITATVYSGSMAPSVTTKTLSEIKEVKLDSRQNGVTGPALDVGY
jgi:hypothetical protein